MRDGAFKFHVTQLALNHLAKYINKNCNNTNEDVNKLPSIFLVYLFSEFDTKRCFHYSDKEIRSYFRNMVLWIENSEFKEEYEDVLPTLRIYSTEFKSKIGGNG